MSDARIQRKFPDVPEHLRSIALLAETLAMARELEINATELDTRHTELTADIRQAMSTLQDSVSDLVAGLSEAQLADGLASGLFSPEDMEDALRYKRLMEIERGKAVQQSHEHDR